MKLRNINKENVFKVPENYFENFPDRIQEKIQKDSGKKPGRLVSLPYTIKLAVAASILVLITFGIYQLYQDGKSIDQLLSEVPTETLISYLSESEMSTEELLEAIDVGLITQDNDMIDPYFVPDEEMSDDLIEDIIIDYELDLQI